MATTTLTNATISETYVSLLHSNGEILPATGQVVIYDGCGNESSIKIGRCSSSAGLTVCGSISASGTLDGDWSTLIDLVYPVGSVFFSANNVNPGVRFTGTTWTQISQGRFIAGVGQGNDGTDTHTVAPSADSGTGKYNHQLTVDEMPSHTHFVAGMTRTGGYLSGDPSKVVSWKSNFASGNVDYAFFQASEANGGTSSSVGGSQSHNNIPPYFGLYVWERTA